MFSIKVNINHEQLVQMLPLKLILAMASSKSLADGSRHVHSSIQFAQYVLV